MRFSSGPRACVMSGARAAGEKFETDAGPRPLDGARHAVPDAMNIAFSIPVGRFAGSCDAFFIHLFFFMFFITRTRTVARHVPRMITRIKNILYTTATIHPSGRPVTVSPATRPIGSDRVFSRIAYNALSIWYFNSPTKTYYRAKNDCILRIVFYSTIENTQAVRSSTIRV